MYTLSSNRSLSIMSTLQINKSVNQRVKNTSVEETKTGALLLIRKEN